MILLWIFLIYLSGAIVALGLTIFANRYVFHTSYWKVDFKDVPLVSAVSYLGAIVMIFGMIGCAFERLSEVSRKNSDNGSTWSKIVKFVEGD